MKLSKRDEMLLFLLGVLILLCLPYFLIVRPYQDKTMAVEMNIKTLQERKAELDALEARRTEFESGILAAGVEREEILERFPTELPQEGSILFLYDTEKSIPIILSQAAFDPDEIIPINEGDLPADAAGAADQTAVLTGLTASSQIVYSGEYNNFKKFLEYVMNYKDRMVITNLSATYSLDMDTVWGNLTLKQYALAGDGRYSVYVRDVNMRKGTSNIFLEASGNAPGGQESADRNSPDFFLMLSQPKAEVDAVIFGKSRDGMNNTHLTSKENKVQKAVITFEGSGGSYTANYQIGDKMYADGDGISFSKDGTIIFEIISSPRVGDEDKVGVTLDIINRTDQSVNAVIKNDDTENPRVTVSGKTGKVTVG